MNLKKIMLHVNRKQRIMLHAIQFDPFINKNCTFLFASVNFHIEASQLI